MNTVFIFLIFDIPRWRGCPAGTGVGYLILIKLLFPSLRSFFLRPKKTNQKKVFAKNMPPLPLWHF